jgi:formate hydrogenlyase subunit 3/multisubunit Na+/H+ antiporter MnhD subunit
MVFKFSASASLNLPWHVPYGSFSVSIDKLSALFLAVVYILSALSALYGLGYLRHYHGKKNIGSSWLCFNILVAGMATVIIARNAVLFLMAWEMMSISSFFLVLFEGENRQTAHAGLMYLIASGIGTFFLFTVFILLAQNAASFDFAGFGIKGNDPARSAAFICALIGFGTKAGIMPMHVWLPEAHPAAPSHVSALMSAVMIKTGIYGLLRILTFLGMPCPWWGYLLIGIGIITAVLGILFALAQHDLKRLLAYSSIENIGIITIAIGIGVLGVGINNYDLAVIGFCAGVLHVINHAFFKGMLFLSAGSVYYQTGTREIDLLGGLLKKMPVTGVCFLIGSIAICGLPPLNGFISEFLIYLACFRNVSANGVTAVISMSVIVSLALAGAFALACFSKAFGIIFLGQPRSDYCYKACEAGVRMGMPLVFLAAACVISGICAAYIMPFIGSAVSAVAGTPSAEAVEIISSVNSPLIYVAIMGVSFCALIALIALFRGLLLNRRAVEYGPTWDCGYAFPSARMQYTGSSFSQPLIDFFKGILRARKKGARVTGYFPDRLSFETHTDDIFAESIFRPMQAAVHALAGRLAWFQHGRLQSYILYIFIALIILFMWKL